MLHRPQGRLRSDRPSGCALRRAAHEDVPLSVGAQSPSTCALLCHRHAVSLSVLCGMLCAAAGTSSRGRSERRLCRWPLLWQGAALTMVMCTQCAQCPRAQCLVPSDVARAQVLSWEAPSLWNFDGGPDSSSAGRLVSSHDGFAAALEWQSGGEAAQPELSVRSAHCAPPPQHTCRLQR